ncbi:hypothetical protein DEO72_LG4g933 [Vigna unguiculata]|uniref:Uncharacterized protein n=1 Tax=Vigna unguiculata TaxID=3917 RepID=A0A4D6LN74_VIGUN|nr:hypothetical protein DEO72_LG4g933 [Vigna unguiculata]
MQARTVANTDNLAQASWPRLGEMSRGTPRAFYASCRSGDQTLGEIAHGLLFNLSSFRLGEWELT